MPQQKTNIETAIMPFKVQQLVEIIMHKKQLDYEEEKKTKMQDNPKILLFFSGCTTNFPISV
ncbi:hypothetical protein AGMMS50239_07290 [Bacteroidia bacterium]|nr:hypothetical protein AGMMS50239_07290 [Bacteroidia bacterium]GHV32361.1 hypothetical protein FACS1894177_08390 [Bacteroidia bacterium]